MKRLIRNNIYATSTLCNNRIMFTIDDIVSLLSEIEQLKDCKITVTENTDGLKLTVGDYVYELTN